MVFVPFIYIPHALAPTLDPRDFNTTCDIINNTVLNCISHPIPTPVPPVSEFQTWTNLILVIIVFGSLIMLACHIFLNYILNKR